VAEGGRPPPAPTDPDVRDSRKGVASSAISGLLLNRNVADAPEEQARVKPGMTRTDMF